MTLALMELHATRRGVNPNWVHTRQNGKIVHTHFGLAPQRSLLSFAHVVCEPWGPMSISPMTYMVHWSMRPACTRVLNMVHGGQKMWKIAQNGRKCTHSWLGQIEAHARLGPECAIGLVSSHMCPTYLLGVAQLLLFWEWQGR